MVPAWPTSTQRRNSGPWSGGAAGPMAARSKPSSSARAFTDAVSVASLSIPRPTSGATRRTGGGPLSGDHPAGCRPSASPGPRTERCRRARAGESCLSRLDDQVAPRERAAPRLEEGEVAIPASIGLPAVLEPDRRRQPLLHRRELLHLALHLDHLGLEARAPEHRLHPGLVIGEAGDLARLAPLGHVEGAHAERSAGRQ